MFVSCNQNFLQSGSGHVTPFAILGIYEYLYNFDTVLYQFLETETSDRTN